MHRCLVCDRPYAGKAWTCTNCGSTPTRLGDFYAFAPDVQGDDLGFEAEYFGPLAALEEGSFWFRARNQLLEWVVTTRFPDARRFLEVGCGTGYVLAHLARARPALELTGLEMFSEALEYAASRLSGVELLQADARHLPFSDEFDIVGAFDVLEHIDDDTAALREMNRALRPRGGLILTVPQHRWLWSASDDYARHHRRYRRGELTHRVQQAGFEVLLVTSFVSLLTPLMLASRLRNARSAASYDPHAEFALPRTLDRGLEMVMAAERRAIRAGLRLPVGGSLLVVARRRD